MIEKTRKINLDNIVNNDNVGHRRRDFGRSSRPNRYVSRRYYLAFEGLTEFLYFSMIRDCGSTLGIRNEIDIITLQREYQNKDVTTIKFMKDAVSDYKHVVKTGIYSTTLFVAVLINDLCDRVSRGLSKEKKTTLNHSTDEMEEKDVKSKYKMYGDLLVEIASFLQYQLIEIVTENNLDKDKISKDDEDKLTNICKDYISNVALVNSDGDRILIGCDDGKETELENDYSIGDGNHIISWIKSQAKFINKPKNRKQDSYDENLDVFSLVLDRDKRCDDRTDIDFNELISDCDNRRISLYITNPAFEFWLIMHFDDLLKKVNDEEMYENRKSHRKGNSTKRNYAEWLLNDYFDTGYSKFELPYNRFIADDCKPIKNAIAVAEENYCHSNDELVLKIGSSVGELIQRMIDNC